MQISKVLVVDGDHAARDALVTCLRFVGMDAHGAENADAAQCWLKSDVADVLVLADDVAEGMSTDARASIIVLTRSDAAPATHAHVRVSNTLRRPVAISRVVERVESLIQERGLREDPVVRFGALSLDIGRGRVACGESRIALTQAETRLLAFFIALPEKVFSRAFLLERLWPSNARVAERTVDVHIRRLRLALAQLGCEGYIQTVRCSGYRFSAF
jgi:two-component system phosphate regulon response regulator PhoB